MEIDESSEMSTAEESPEKPKKKKPSSTPVRPKTPKGLNSTLTKLSAFEAEDEDEKTVWEHEKLHWLKSENVKDKNGNPKSSEDYDPTTLQVPADFIKGLTPGMGNWWKIKAKNFDVVIFYKVGKFYELYHMDAMVGVANLGFSFMRGKFAHCGFPEMRFDHFASMLVNKGYKVARVEQTETQEANKQRVKESKDWAGNKKALDKFQKQTRREICRIESPGTRVAALNSAGALPAAESLIAAVFESDKETGIAFCDTSQGVVTLGQFVDDSFCSNLRTFMAHRGVGQLIYQKNECLSDNLRQILAGTSSDMAVERLPSKLFPSIEKTSKVIRETATEEIKMDGLLTLIDENPVGARALGAIIFQLKRYEVLHEVLRTAKFESYVSPTSQKVATKGASRNANRRMVLDSMTLHNLDIIASPAADSGGSLEKRINTCASAGGKRRLRDIIVSPPGNKQVIEAKQRLIRGDSKLKAARSGCFRFPRNVPFPYFAKCTQRTDFKF